MPRACATGRHENGGQPRRVSRRGTSAYVAHGRRGAPASQPRHRHRRGGDPDTTRRIERKVGYLQHSIRSEADACVVERSRAVGPMQDDPARGITVWVRDPWARADNLVRRDRGAHWLAAAFISRRTLPSFRTGRFCLALLGRVHIDTCDSEWRGPWMNASRRCEILLRGARARLSHFLHVLAGFVDVSRERFRSDYVLAVDTRHLLHRIRRIRRIRRVIGHFERDAEVDGHHAIAVRAIGKRGVRAFPGALVHLREQTSRATAIAHHPNCTPIGMTCDELPCAERRHGVRYDTYARIRAGAPIRTCSHEGLCIPRTAVGGGHSSRHARSWRGRRLYSVCSGARRGPGARSRGAGTSSHANDHGAVHEDATLAPLGRPDDARVLGVVRAPEAEAQALALLPSSTCARGPDVRAMTRRAVPGGAPATSGVERMTPDGPESVAL